MGFIFGGLGALASVICWAYIPELKGRTVYEINQMFQNKVPPRHMRSHKLSESETYQVA